MKLRERTLTAAFCMVVVLSFVGSASADPRSMTLKSQANSNFIPFSAYCAQGNLKDGDPCPPCQNGKCAGVCRGGFCMPAN